MDTIVYKSECAALSLSPQASVTLHSPRWTWPHQTSVSIDIAPSQERVSIAQTTDLQGVPLQSCGRSMAHSLYPRSPGLYYHSWPNTSALSHPSRHTHYQPPTCTSISCLHTNSHKYTRFLHQHAVVEVGMSPKRSQITIYMIFFFTWTHWSSFPWANQSVSHGREKRSDCRAGPGRRSGRLAGREGGR